METGEDDHPELDKKEEAWGSVASNVSDPQKCIEECRAQVLARVVPGFNGSRYNEVCKHLLADDEDAMNTLWELYCCDATECGVHLSGKPELGQDPSVNLVINVCQGIFAPVIKDPGPPPDDSICPISLNGPFINTDMRPSYKTDSRGREPIFTDFGIMATVPPEVMPSAASSTASSASKTSAHLTTSATAYPTSFIPLANQSQTHRKDGLPTGTKVAIGTSSAIAFLAIIAFVICLFRRRSRDDYDHSLKSEIGHPNPQPDTSPTPLSSHLYSIREGIRTPLTPPPRLQQRRLLSTHVSLERPSINVNVSIPGTPLGASVEKAGVFSSSPLSTPTPTATNRVPPKYDRSTKPYYGVSPPPNTFGQGTGGSPRFSGKTSSMSSATSGRTATTASNVSSIAPRLTPSSWPMRPPRPHEKRLLIPDLVCPGPSPACSLPPAPPGSPSSPVSFHKKLLLQQLQQQQKRGDFFDDVSAAVSNGWVPPRNPARGVVLEKESRDLCELTETYARESRERSSWGSWSIGGGGTGVGASSVQKGGGSVNSPVLEEADLEKIGGRY
ncbi:hypothetical protein CABS01_10915 [Colletotrichum abscissum]|uniref:uncharacterized protein n=1 Tax=Colletotrichum abscissum TaxID=1671311 RepID=UPI0027D55368|nr:uncharacterized protein CABS01_10915 [Colletotrichum abscissum]KAK1496766.1 hypothetical protein CABS01_10915 [Colletotrichum abscissum]